MTVSNKAHDYCEFIAILKIWKVCQNKSPGWVKIYLARMARESREFMLPKQSVKEKDNG